MRENEGTNQGIRLKFAPLQGIGEFNLLNIKLYFQLTLSLTKTWGLDQKFCPTVREIAFQEDQIPSYFPTFPAVGGAKL